MNDLIAEWLLLWCIPPEALEDLHRRTCMLAVAHVPSVPPKGEAYVQSKVRLDAPSYSSVLYRNNVGALTPKNSDRPVRFGLANDSKQLNETIKSGDLIGYVSFIIEQRHVGMRIAQFASAECKHEGWELGRCDPESEQGRHEAAQLRWQASVIAGGGLASFTTGGWPWPKI